MIDRYGFAQDMKELREEGDLNKIEFYLNQQFMELKDSTLPEAKPSC